MNYPGPKVWARWNLDDFGRTASLYIAQQAGDGMLEVAVESTEFGLVMRRQEEALRVDPLLRGVPAHWIGPISEAGTEYNESEWKARYDELSKRLLVEERRVDTAFDRGLLRPR